ncbi:hypothetical protein PF008_g10654 [Phytophthora fragariae]|uniref:Protein kinase domain-containing protein n=1 Tax=Phytophthora fragariae TaxID=53985 RepID=A0A6G0RT31_9STRA|nr:hypothetical protein PF008_g10654 [Phytophthora fragariae]
MSSSSSSSSSCTRNQTALTSQCNSLCAEGRPCVAYAAGDEAACSSSSSTFGTCTADGYCTYECFANGPEDFAANGAIDFSTYTFLIPFGSDVEPSEQELSWSSDQEAAANAALAAVANWTTQHPSKSNDALQHIEPLDFMASTTGVVLAGGSSVFGVRGKVARVQLPQELFTADTQLQAVTLANLALEQILATSLPSGLINLTISNCLMTSYPDDLKTMDALENLDLSKNYYGYFPSDLDLPKLQTLNLSANSLGSFEGSLPSLVTLDLAGNNLTSIPTTIFNMRSLQRLDLRGNNFAVVELTSTQFSFLQDLDEFDVDSLGGAACNTTEKLETSTSTLSVCVSGTTSTEKGDSSSNKALIAGVMAAVIVVFVILAIIFIFRCLRRRAERLKPDPEIINFHCELISPTEHPEYARRLSAERYSEPDSDVGAAPERHCFPYNDELGMLLLNVDDLEYIRKLTSEYRPNRHHHMTFLTRFRGSRFLVCKRLQQEVLDEASDTQRFADEVRLAASLDHPRIVALVGVLWSRTYGLEALYEYMEGGDLRSYLAQVEGSSSDLRSWRSLSAWKLQIAFDVAEALAYAHAFSPRLVHRDLTSHSVLLSSPPELRARLDEFVTEQQALPSMPTIGLSLREERWLPPEVITGAADYSPAADMYAFGVILSEIDTHSLPYENIQGVVSGRRSMSDVEILDLVVSGKLHPVFTLGCPTGVRELAERCLSYDASDRPTALQAAIVLRTLLSEDRRTSFAV